MLYIEREGERVVYIYIYIYKFLMQILRESVVAILSRHIERISCSYPI